MIDIQFEIEPDYHRVVEEIREDIDDQVEAGMKYVAENAPREMQLLMPENPPSVRGSAPAQRTKTLFNSLQGELKADGTVEIQMAEHAFFLDPVFEDEGGGYLDRPFLLVGIDTSVQKAFDRV